ncbi:MAG: CBS domain-containing protein [Syntrophobacterales bacterium]|nr:CBS domain-containing protein [Syntrophobacterales bacterium]
MYTARDIMTREVVTAGPEDSVEDLARLLAERRISGVPVVDDQGRVLGVVTQSDLLKRTREPTLPVALNILDLHLFLETPGRFRQRLEKLLGHTVRQVMSSPAITVAPDTPVSELARLMEDKGIHTLPVVEEGRLVGIVGKLDLIRVLARPSA